MTISGGEMADLKFWGLMALVYVAGYYLWGLIHLHRIRNRNAPEASVWRLLCDRNLLLATGRCVAMSMGTLIGIQIANPNRMVQFERAVAAARLPLSRLRYKEIGCGHRH